MNVKQAFGKHLIGALGATATAVLLASSALSHADDQTSAGEQRSYTGHMQHGDRAAAMQKHLDKLKAELQLQPNQEGAWQAYTAKLTEQMQKMKALHQASSNVPQTLPDRLDRRTEAMKQHLAGMEESNAALKALYATLTPEQRAVMDKKFSHGGRHHA